MGSPTGDMKRHKLLTVQERDPLSLAFRLMKENSIRHLPVKDEQGKYVGILSNRDIMRAAESSLSYEHGLVFEDLKLANHLLVEDYMTSPVETLPTDTPLKTIAEKMVEFKISCFLITQDAEIVGIVTTDDILRYLAFILDGMPHNWEINAKSLFADPFVKFRKAVADD